MAINGKKHICLKSIQARFVNVALALTSLLLVCGSDTQLLQAQSFAVLYNFGSGTDGQTPYAGLIRDSKGNLYGATRYGGADGDGVVFKLTATETETVLHSFTNTGGDGYYPFASLMRDAAGNLYGTTVYGGSEGCGGYGCGVVFKLGRTSNETILYDFTGTGVDGANPFGGVIADSKGNLYGTTYVGGSSGNGTVFKLSKMGKETTLHTFTGGVDGGLPVAGLISDRAGNFYGTTQFGGTSDSGTVFKVGKSGKLTVLYSFAGGADGAYPEAGLLRDKADNIYGTTTSGGPSGHGTVFKLNKAHKETILYAFQGGSDGAFPHGALVTDAAGNLYGTTVEGGSHSFGTVFKVTKAGKETVLYSFTSQLDGGLPYAGLVTDSSGNLYGTTVQGGKFGFGTVFLIAP